MTKTMTNPIFRTDPIPGYRFAVLWGGIIRGWFTECSGITIERDVLAHAEGGVNDYVHQLPGRLTQAKVTLKHGLAGNELWSWFQQGQVDGQVEHRHLSIVLYDSWLLPVSSWNLIDAYPARWVGSGLKSDSQEALVEEVEFACEGSSRLNPEQLVQRANGIPAVESAGSGQPIDLMVLAKKIYGLLKTDLRVERERLGRKW